MRLKSRLSGDADGGEDRTVLVPQADAVEVIRAVLIINDDGGNIVAQALLEHQQAANPTVAVIEGADAFKLYVKVQNILEGNIGNTLITFEHGGQFFTDSCRRNFEARFEGCRACAKHAGLDRCHFMTADIAEQKRVQFEGKSRLERLGRVGDDIVQTEKMIAHLDEIIELHIFVGKEQFALFEEVFHMISGQTITGHTTGAVREIDLQVVVDVRVISVLLSKQFFQQGRSFTFFGVCPDGIAGLLRILGDLPNAVFNEGVGDLASGAVSPDHGGGDAPFQGDFICGQVFHLFAPFAVRFYSGCGGCNSATVTCNL